MYLRDLNNVLDERILRWRHRARSWSKVLLTLITPILVFGALFVFVGEFFTAHCTFGQFPEPSLTEGFANTILSAFGVLAILGAGVYLRVFASRSIDEMASACKQVTITAGLFLGLGGAVYLFAVARSLRML